MAPLSFLTPAIRLSMFFCILSILPASIPAVAATSFEIPLNDLKQPPTSPTTSYEIPLGELKRLTKTKPRKKRPEQKVKTTPATSPVKKQKKQPDPPPDPVLWGTLESVRLVDEGVRVDFDDLRDKFILLLEPLNKKIVLQFVGLSYPSGDTKLPLGSNGFVQARIGRHPDGTWVVLETSDTTLPEFELRRDSNGIILKTTASDRATEIEEFSGQFLLLTKEAVAAERRHVFTPEKYDFPPEEAPSEQPEDEEPSPDEKQNVSPVPAEETDPGRISHIPFSFAVAGRQTTIHAVVSSSHEIREVYCVVQTADEVKPAIILMTKAADALYTYEGKLPGQPANSQALRYTIVVRDTDGHEIRSREYETPITPSLVVPGWQR
jgi:hypothetical protein